MLRLIRCTLTAASLLIAASAAFAQAADGGARDARPALTVFVGGAVTAAVKDAGAAYERRTGTMVVYVSDTTGGLQKRLAAGEKADVVVATAPGLDAMEKEKLTVRGTRANLARALIGVAVKAGAPSPDLSTPDAFKAALLKARSLSYVSPAAGGTSGTYIEGLLQKMGIADAMKPKIVYRNQGSEVAAAVANGDAELGISFSAELTPNKGVKVAGALPNAIQLPTLYAAALTNAGSVKPTARAFVGTLTGPDGRAALVRAGLEPIDRSER